MITLKRCFLCGGEGAERVGPGFESFICGIPVGHIYGTYIWCRECGRRTDSYDQPWKAIRAWNREPMIYDLSGQEPTEEGGEIDAAHLQMRRNGQSY